MCLKAQLSCLQISFFKWLLIIEQLRWNLPSLNGSDNVSQWERLSFYSLIFIRSHWRLRNILDIVCQNILGQSNTHFKSSRISAFFSFSCIFQLCLMTTCGSRGRRMASTWSWSHWGWFWCSPTCPLFSWVAGHCRKCYLKYQNSLRRQLLHYTSN